MKKLHLGAVKWIILLVPLAVGIAYAVSATNRDFNELVTIGGTLNTQVIAAIRQPFNELVTIGGTLNTQVIAAIRPTFSERVGINERLDISFSDDRNLKSHVAGKIIMSEAGSTTFQVNADGRTFNISVTGEGVKSLMFSQDEHVITLENDGSAGTVEVEIPKGLLDGNFTIMAGNQQIDFVLSETETYSTLLFDKPADSSIVTVHGTTAIPEFPVPMLVFVIIATLGSLFMLANSKLKNKIR